MAKLVFCVIAVFAVGCSATSQSAPSAVPSSTARTPSPLVTADLPKLVAMADSCPHGKPTLQPIEKGETWAKGSWSPMQGITQFETAFYEVQNNGVARSERVDTNSAMFPNALPGTRYRFEVSGITPCGDRTEVASVVFTTDGDVPAQAPAPVATEPPVVNRCGECHEPPPPPDYYSTAALRVLSSHHPTIN